MYHSLFIHSSTEGPTDCFQILVTMNKSAINHCVQVFVWICFQPLRVNTMEHNCWIIWYEYVSLYKKLANRLPKGLYYLALSPQWMKVIASQFWHYLDVVHSDRCIVVSHFSLHFLDDMLNAFSYMLTCHLYIFFGDVSVNVFCPFFKQVIVEF